MDGMEGSYPGKLRIWESWTSAVVEEPPAFVAGHALSGPHHPLEFADRLYAFEALNPLANSPPLGEGAEPYTLQWFLNIENQRHSRQGRWIPHVLEFAKHSGETLLGLGDGLGTDWLQYARHGAVVVVCSSSADQLALIRRNFELRGLEGRFLHSTPAALPLGNASIDVACVSGLLHEVADPSGVVQEIYRVLKPGGKVLAVTPARFDVDFWSKFSFPWRPWCDNKSRQEAAGVRFTARSLRRLFEQFVEHRVYKRHLRRGDVPHVWRWVPLPLLERLMGRVLVLKTFKPLSAAMTVPLAA
jgi:SAM-dependent methyltransferase